MPKLRLAKLIGFEGLKKINFQINKERQLVLKMIQDLVKVYLDFDTIFENNIEILNIKKSNNL